MPRSPQAKLCSHCPVPTCPAVLLARCHSLLPPLTKLPGTIKANQDHWHVFVSSGTLQILGWPGVSRAPAEPGGSDPTPLLPTTAPTKVTLGHKFLLNLHLLPSCPCLSLYG